MKLHRNQHKKEIHKKKPQKTALICSIAALFFMHVVSFTNLVYIHRRRYIFITKKFFPLNKYYFEYFFLIVQKQFVKKMHRLHTFIQNFIHITKTETNIIK